MLRIFRSMKELPFSEMMQVYAETNQQYGKQHWRFETAARQEALAEEETYRYLRFHFFTSPGAACYAWYVCGKPVSALRLEPDGEAYLLTALETAPQERGKGYAKALIQAVLGSLPQGAGQKVHSHIHKHNAASIAVHTACGFRKLRDTAVMLDGSVKPGMYTYEYRNGPFMADVPQKHGN